jgi:hypothetical protein
MTAIELMDKLSIEVQRELSGDDSDKLRVALVKAAVVKRGYDLIAESALSESRLCKNCGAQSVLPGEELCEYCKPK